MHLIFKVTINSLDVAKLRIDAKENHCYKENKDPKIWPRQNGQCLRKYIETERRA